MSTTIDENVVELRFDNSQFESGVRESMGTIEQLNQSLNIEEGAQAFKVQFSAMQIVAATAISQITKTVMSGISKLSSMTMGQIISGGQARAAKIEAAKFQLEGLHVAWKDIEEDINYGVADTAYGLDAAAVAASQLVASGVKFGEASDDMKKALRGISGVAAMTNSTYEDTAAIFTTVAGQGKLMTMQLRQLESRGLNAAAKLGEVLGKSEAEIRDMVTKGQIDFKTFSDAMDQAFGEHAKDANKTLTGVISNIRSALSKIGADFYSPIIANEGPLVNMLDHIRAIANAVRMYIKPDVTAVAESVNGVITKISGKLAGLYKETTKVSYEYDVLTHKIIRKTTKQNELMPGLTNFIDSIKEKVLATLELLLRIIDPIRKAFRDIFPKQSLQGMADFNNTLTSIIKSLWLSERGMADLRATFRGLFSIMHLVRTVILSVFKAASPMFSDVKNFAELILRLTGFLGNIVTVIVRVIEKSGILQLIIQVVGAALHTLLYVVSNITTVFANFIEQVGQLEIVQDMMAGLQKILEKLGGSAGNAAVGALNAILTVILGIAGAVNKFYVKYIRGFSFQQVLINLKTIFLALGAVIFDIVKRSGLGKFFETIYKASAKAAKGLVAFANGMTLAKLKTIVAIASITALTVSIVSMVWNMSMAIRSVTGFMKSLKTLIRPTFMMKLPDTFRQFAISIALIVGSLYVLSKIDTNTLYDCVTVLSNLAITMFIVTAGMVALDRVMGNNNALAKLGAGFLAMSASVLVLTMAMQNLQGLHFSADLVANLGILLVVMAGLTAIAAKLMTMDAQTAKKSILGTISMVGFVIKLLALCVAIKVLVGVLKDLSKIDPDKLATSAISLFEMLIGISAVMASTRGLGIGAGLGLIFMTEALKTCLPEIEKLLKTEKFSALKKVLEEDTDVLLTFGTFCLTVIAVTALAGSGFLKFATGIFVATVVMEMLIGFCKVVAKVPVENLKKGLTVVGIMYSMFAALAFASKFTEKAQMVKFALAVGMLTTNMITLLVLSVIISKIKTDALSKGVTVVGLFVGMTAAIMYMSKFTKKAKTSLKEMYGIIALMGLLFGALLIFSFINTNKLLKSVFSITTVLVALSTTFIAINKIVVKPNELKAKIAGIAVVLLELVVLVAALSWLDNYLNGSVMVTCASLSVMMLALSASLKIIDGVSKGIDIKMIGNISIMIGVIYLLGQLFGILDDMDMNGSNLAMVSLAISTALVSIAGSLLMVSNISSGINSANILKLAAGMIPVYLIGVSLAGVSRICDWKAMIPSAISIGIVMNLLVSALTIERNINPEILGELLVAVAIIVPMALSLAALSKQPWMNIIASTIAMATTFSVLTEFLNEMALASGSIKTAGSSLLYVAAIAGLIVVVAYTLSSISSIPWPKLLVSIIAMDTTLFATIKMLSILSSSSGELAESLPALVMLGALVAGMIGIATAFAIMSSFDWESLIASAISMGLLSLALSKACWILSDSASMSITEAIPTALMLVVLSKCIGVLALELSLLSGFDWSKMISCVVSLSALILAITGCTYILSFSKATTAAAIPTLILLIGVANLIRGLGFTLALVSAFDWNNILSTVIAVGAVGVVLSGVTALLALIGTTQAPAILAVCAAFIAVGASTLVLAAGLSLLNKPLKEFSGLDLIGMASGTIALAGAFISLAASGIALILGWIGIAASAKAIAEMESPLLNFAKAMMAVRDIIDNLSVDNLAKVAEEYCDYGVRIIAGICEGIINGLPDVIEAFTQLSKSMTEALRNGDEGSWNELFVQAGRDAALGLKKGIDDESPAIINTMKKFANAILAPLRLIWGWHSPWQIMVQAGKDMITGFDNSVNNNTDNSVKAAENYAERVSNALGIKFQNGTKNIIDSVAKMDKDVADKLNGSAQQKPNTTGRSEAKIDKSDRNVYDENGVKYEIQANDILEQEWGRRAILTRDMKEQFRDVANMRQEDMWQAENWGKVIADQCKAGKMSYEQYQQIVEFVALRNEDAALAVRKGYGESVEYYKEQTKEAEEIRKKEAAEIEKDCHSAAYYTAWTINGLEDVTDKALSTVPIVNWAWKATKDGVEGCGEGVEYLKDKAVDATKGYFGMNIEMGNTNDIMSQTQALTKDFGIDMENLGYETYSVDNNLSMLDKYLIEFGINEDEVGHKTAELEGELARLKEQMLATAQAMHYMKDYAKAEDSYTYNERKKQLEQQEKEYRKLQDQLKNVGSTSVGGGGGAAKEVEKLNETLRDSISIFDEFTKASELSSAQVLKNMQSQLNGMASWSKSLALLAERGISKEFYEKLRDMGTSGYETINALAKMTDAELAYANRMFSAQVAVSDQAAVLIENNNKNLTYNTKELASKSAVEISKSATQAAVKEIQNGGNSMSEATKKAVEETSKALAKSSFKKDLSKFAYELTQTTDNTDDLNKKLKEFADATAAAHPELAKLGYTAQDVSDAVLGLSSEMSVMKDSIADNIKGSINLFEEFNTEFETTSDDMINNMKSQIEGLTQWSNDIASLAGKGLDKGLIMQLQDLGPAGAEQVHAFATMTADQISQANSLYTQSLQFPQEAADKLVKSYSDAGFFFSQGFAEGIDPNAANENIMEMGYTSLDQLRNVLGIHSPSKETFKIGEFTVEGYNKGISTRMPATRAMITMFSEKIVSRLRETLSYGRFREIGVYACEGLSAGINEMASTVAEDAARMARSVYEAACNALKIKSPSRLFIEIGKYVDLGLAKGIQNYASAAIIATEQLADDTLNAADGVFNVIDWDSTPIIKPTLDLSEVRDGANKINKMFANRELQAAIDTDNQNGSGTPNGMTFIQNNYSPKALSRIDIYRQTSNQFSMMKGMVNGT